MHGNLLFAPGLDGCAGCEKDAHHREPKMVINSLSLIFCAGSLITGFGAWRWPNISSKVRHITASTTRDVGHDPCPVV